jgi:hypothetical protein
MTKIPFLLTLLVALLVCSLPIAPAQALVNRTFVSAAGSDSNNCANVATPCRHLAAAYAATAANGEIYVLDPANYGSLTITGPVSIEGHGWASIAPPSGGNAITINANPGDAINIIGVVLDGTALASTNGIVFNSGGSLTVADSVVRNFHSSGIGETTGNGILLQPTSGTVNFAITNSIVANNQITGIIYSPPSGSPAANIVIDHVTATGNSFIGITINLLHATGGSAVAAISNSTVSNAANGIDLDNNTLPLTTSIDNVNAVGNTSNGIVAFGTSKVLLGRSVVTGNFTGIQNQTSPNTFFTYKDNRIDENGTDICSTAGCLPLNTTLVLQ